MESSPKGREIETVAGHPEAIVTRGNAITKLGNQMIDSAVTLKSIADGATGQKGLAVDKLKDVVGDCYKDLKLAGERYKPTGPALVAYGTTLGDVQPKIASIVKDAEDDWNTYQQKYGAVPPAPSPGPAPSPNPTPEQTAADKKAKQEHDDAKQAADTAYANWKADAEKFDTYYDTWEEAFDKAVNEIGHADSGGIKDSFWDNLDGFVAAALEVLKWVGIVLAVACIIVGGPLLMAMAAVVAIATLALTTYSYFRGNSSLSDLIFAAIGVIPFGSAGKLLGGGKMEFVNDMFGGLLRSGTRGAIAGDFGNMVHGLTTGFSRGGGGLSGLLRGVKGGYMAIAGPSGTGAGNIISRLFTGQNMRSIGQPGVNPVSILGSIWGDGFTKNIFGIPDSLFDLHNKVGATS